MRPARAMSARSLRQAWMRSSIGRDGPSSRNWSSVLEDESVLAGGAALRARRFEVPVEAFKKILSRAGLRDEHVAPVGFVADAAQIAERPERVQGARDHGFGNAEAVGEAAHGVRPGSEVDQQH